MVSGNSQRMDTGMAIQLLREAYENGGYIRVKRDRRQANSFGWEIRLYASNEKELKWLQLALASQKFIHGKPYSKGRGFVLPLYGRDQIERFLWRTKARRKNTIPDPPPA